MTLNRSVGGGGWKMRKNASKSELYMIVASGSCCCWENTIGLSVIIITHGWHQQLWSGGTGMHGKMLNRPIKEQVLRERDKGYGEYCQNQDSTTWEGFIATSEPGLLFRWQWRHVYDTATSALKVSYRQQQEYGIEKSNATIH